MAWASDVIVLAAGKDEEHAVRGLLSRPAALNIRPVSATFLVHPHHDAGCYRGASELLRGYLQACSRALVVFDREGSGADRLPAGEIAARVEEDLAANGWRDRAAAIVLDPEVEVWVWSDSPEGDAILGWHGALPPLRDWLADEGLWPRDAQKPPDPREAYLRALTRVRAAKSSARFEQLGARVSVKRCTDPAFSKLLHTLREWFPAGEVTDHE